MLVSYVSQAPYVHSNTAAHPSVELDPEATVVSLGGRSAYDCVTGRFPPQVRGSCSSALAVCASGTARAFAITPSRARAVSRGARCPLRSTPWRSTTACSLLRRRCDQAISLAAFLDDLFVFASASRARDGDNVVHARLKSTLESSKLGKTRVYFRAGGPPPQALLS